MRLMEWKGCRDCCDGLGGGGRLFDFSRQEGGGRGSMEGSMAGSREGRMEGWMEGSME